jgi:hypothetical protein
MPEQSTPDEPHDERFDERFDEFASRASGQVPAPDLTDVRARARRRRTSGWAVAAAAVTVLAAPVAVYAVAGRTSPPADRAAAVPSASATTAAATRSTGPVAATSPATSNAIERTDWANVTLNIPPNETGCAAGHAAFNHSAATVAGTGYHLGSGHLDSIVVAYGDVDADAQADALLVVSCVTPAGRHNPPSVLLLVTATPTLHTMALSFSTSPRVGDGEGKSSIATPMVHPDGGISFDVRTYEGNGQCDYRQRWTGTALTGACEP